MFLSVPCGFRKRAVRPKPSRGANCPHGPVCVFLREHGSSFCHRVECPMTTPELLPSLKRRRWGRRSHRRVTEPFRCAYGFGWPGCSGSAARTAWDFHRSVWSAIVPRRHHQPPCRSAAGNRRTCREGKRQLPPPQGFGRLRSVAHRRRPKRDTSRATPCLAPPSAPVAVRCWLHSLP
jgi:hypothetical protein